MHTCTHIHLRRTARMQWLLALRSGPRPAPIEALVQILNRSNSEAVLQQALVALWNAATVDANKTLVRTVGGLSAIVGAGGPLPRRCMTSGVLLQKPCKRKL